MITSCNNEVLRVLGYQKVELIEQNISKIMPKVYGDIHDDLMKRYINTTEAIVMNKERMVLCMNKNGYLLPCSLMIKIVPNLEEGI